MLLVTMQVPQPSGACETKAWGKLEQEPKELLLWSKHPLRWCRTIQQARGTAKSQDLMAKVDFTGAAEGVIGLNDDYTFLLASSPNPRPLHNAQW